MAEEAGWRESCGRGGPDTILGCFGGEELFSEVTSILVWARDGGDDIEEREEATLNTAAISVASALPISVPDAGLVSAAPLMAAQAVKAPTDSQVTGSAMVQDPAHALGDTNPRDQANGNKPDDLAIVPGVADIDPVTAERIKKILNFENDEKNVYAVKNVPVSAMWSRAGSFIIDSIHQKAVLVWIVGRVDFKNISNAGRLVAVNIKPLDDADVNAANLLMHRYFQPQLKASDSKYNNIRLSFYVSQYETIGAKVSDDPIGDKFWDSTEAFKKKIRLPFDNLKIDDVILTEAFMRKYAMKDGGRKAGGYCLSFDLSAIHLLHAVSLKEHEDFVAEKNAASVAQATQGDDIKL
ncbi:hypothetical protein FRC05_005388 [Tulasnella sp. 425]|nr:hypothetical protein FRC05_005388 [Tulasnella sp. 425]